MSRVGTQQSTVALPAEVWLKIAECMGHHEWARASGTCRATWQLQMDVVRMDDHLPDAGVRWVLKRAQQARQLLFGPFANQRKTIAAALTTLQSESSWTFLKAFSFDDGLVSDDEKQFVPVKDFGAFSWVLGKAKSLEHLRLHCMTLQPLPSLCNMKHAQILFEDDGSDISSCLSTLHHLETLFLSCFREEKVCDLCFGDFQRLQSLMLDGFVLKTLVIPEVTALLVRLFSFNAAREAIWASHASQLRSLCVTALYMGIDAAHELPQFLFNSRQSGMKSVSLIAGHLGCKESPIRLSGALLEVEQLHLHTIDGMHLDFPGGLFPGHSVYIRSESELNIQLRSVAGFADSCRLFSFGYGTLRGVDLVRMCSYMTAENRPWAHSADQKCSYIHSPGAPLFEEIFYDVDSVWELLEDLQLTPDGVVPMTL